MIARFWLPGEPECGVVGWAMLAGLAVGLFFEPRVRFSELVPYDGEIAPNRALSGAIPEDAFIV
jgi:hypothetical protein